MLERKITKGMAEKKKIINFIVEGLNIYGI
jgi:hypothetical protein